jgi:uncharacterized RDD family membrane protein YckC
LSTPEFPAEPSAAQPAGTPAPLASWGTRAIGFIIDAAPVWILQAIFFRSTAINVLVSLASIGYIAYIGHLEGITGQTPGKAIMGIKLVNQQGELIGSGSGIGRKFVHILDNIVCLLGWLLPIVDSKRQTIADKVMSTFVVSGLETKPFSVDLWTTPKSAA